MVNAKIEVIPGLQSKSLEIGIMKKILIAEDDISTRRLLVKIVESTGHIAFQSSNGDMACSILRDNPDIKLLITDMHMPNMDGRELISNLKKADEFKNYQGLPIIIISGVNKASDVRDLIDMGASRFMGKPIQAQFLKDYISRLI